MDRNNLSFQAKQLSVLVCLCLLVGFSHAQNRDTIGVMFYNLLNFPTGGGSIPDRDDTLAKIIDYVQPDILLVCELVNSSGANTILNQSLNVGGVTYYQMANFVPNQSTSNSLHNLMYYNSNKIGLKSQTELTTDLRDINKYEVWIKDPNLAATLDTTWLDLYATHLKASTGGSNENRRNLEITVLRNHLNTTPGRNALLGADLNVYDSFEPAYQTITNTGLNPLNDPVGQAGNWHNAPGFANLHTQSTRFTSLGDGATSGLDDRFDQILISNGLVSGAMRLQYLPGSYEAVGQDGNHYNNSIISPPANGVVPNTIASALYYMSDHLPVYLDLEVVYPTLLPINIAQFTGKAVGSSLEIEVKLGAPAYQDQVIIEKSADNRSFVPWAELETHQGTTQFQLRDQQPFIGPNYYRLKSIDQQGQTDFSSVLHLHMDPEAEWNLVIAPSSGSLHRYKLLTPTSLSAQVQLLSSTGELLYTAISDFHPAEDWHSLPLSLPQGIYLLRVHDPQSGKSLVRRLLVH